jgi:hypothetical protein
MHPYKGLRNRLPQVRGGLGIVLLSLALTGTVASGAAPDTTPLAWSNVTAILDRFASTGPETELQIPELIGKTVALRLDFVRAEKDSKAETRHVFRHIEGKHIFACFVTGTAASKGSGELTGRITRIRFVQKDLNGNATYAIWLEADTHKPLR